MRTVRHALALIAVAVCFAILFAVLSSGTADAVSAPQGRFGGPTCQTTGGQLPPDAAWIGKLVGCGTELDSATGARLLELRDQECEGIRAGVPARQMVDETAAELGDRREAVSLFTAAAVWCYNGS